MTAPGPPSALPESRSPIRSPLIPTTLDSASPVQRDLRGGETHAFKVDLAAGQVLDARVEQQGVDVVVRVFAPDGRRRLEVDNPRGADGTGGLERVNWIAEESGDHRLTIRAFGGERTAGAYRLEIEPPRDATPESHVRADAEGAKAEADLKYAQATHASRWQAIDGYRRALAGFVALGDDGRRADSHFRLAETWKVLDKEAQARQEYDAALALYQEVGDRRQQALIHHQICHLQVRRGVSAGLELEPCHRALALWEVVSDRLGAAKSSNELGHGYRLQHDYPRALTWYDRALELWRQLGRPAEEAKTLVNRGRLYARLGDDRQARIDLESALAARRRLGSDREIAMALNSLGFLHAQWQAWAEARQSFEEALELWGEERRDLTVANSLFGLGLCQQGSDDERALAAVQRSLEIFQAIDSPQGEGTARLALGRIRSSMGRFPEAHTTLTQALEVFRLSDDDPGIARTRLALSALHRQLDQLEDARREIEQALAIVENLRASAVAGSELGASFFATKQVYYEHYIDLLMELDARRPTADYATLALAASERARARSLLEALTDRGVRPRPSNDRRQLEAEVLLERQIYEHQNRIRRLRSDPEASAAALRQLENEQLELQRRYDKLQAQTRLGDSPPAEPAPRPVGVREIQERLLDAESMLLEYKLGERRSFLWAVTSETVTVYVLPGRDEIEKLTRLVHQRIAGHQRDARARVRMDLARLSQVLLEPVSARLGRARRLVIVADGALQVLPFEALPLPEGELGPGGLVRRLADAAEVVYLPSASTLAVQRDREAGRQPAPNLLAVVADPVFSPEDPRLAAPRGEPASDAGFQRLRFAGQEAAAILDRVPASRRFVARGFEASRDAVTGGELGRSRILHFATHADVSSGHAGLSHLVLAQVTAEGEPRTDGYWYGYEIYRRDLPAELVVLSACQTALGEEIRGEGLVGLAHSFMHAGAARVVVSLWPVDDRATAVLMERFYENLLVQRLAPAAALRAAKRSIRDRSAWRQPYFWAAFVLQGDWRDIARDA